MGTFPPLAHQHSRLEVTRSARNLSEFPAELLQLIFFYLPPCDLKSAVLVCKRWKGVAENSKLWEDKKLVPEEGENMTLSCAVEVARRRKIQTIQAIGLSSDKHHYLTGNKLV